MKKIVLFVASLAIMTSAVASVTPTDLPKNGAQMFIPIGKTGNKISLKALSEISISDYEKLSGKEMKFMEKLAFKKGQKKLKKSMNADGTFTAKASKKFGRYFGGESGVHWGGFALGFFLGLIGVLLAYVVFEDDFKQNRIKWSWIGLATMAVLYIILWVAVFASVRSSMP